jgi:protease-4
MVAFLRWAGSIGKGVLNGIAKFVVFLILVAVVVIVISLFQGDGLPRNMVLALDLRHRIADSSNVNFALGNQPVTVMDVVLGLDAAERDRRVKGVSLRIGSADLSIADAEEIGTAIKKFRKSGKFVIAHSQGFRRDGPWRLPDGRGFRSDLDATQFPVQRSGRGRGASLLARPTRQDPGESADRKALGL